MDFETYVPDAVRALVAGLLEGEGGFKSWNRELADAETKVQQLERQRGRPGNDDAMSTKLRIECAEAISRRDLVADDVACLHRLGQDDRMKPAYASLVGALGTDDQLSGFIYAAFAARIDYAKHRKQKEDATTLAQEVAKAAALLGDLLQKADRFEQFLPPGFFSVTDLLKKTEHDPSDLNVDKWPDVRRVLLGDPGGLSDVQPRDTDLGEAELTDVGEAARDQIRNAWHTAPSMAHIVATLGREALDCVPSEAGFRGAAVESRQSSPKNEYLRAFGTLLRDNHQLRPDIERDSEIIKAMSTTATVVLNDPDVVVASRDVKTVLKALKSEQARDSD